MFTVLLVCADPSIETAARDAFGDAGCLDLECIPSVDLAVDGEPGLAVIHLVGGDVGPLRRLVAMVRDVPVIALCDEAAIEDAFVAGAAECATLPVRRRELVGRMREALRARAERVRRATRERKMSDAIVALQKEKQDLERLACVDSLTGIANRRHALTLLEAEWRRSARERSSLGIVMIDLDCYHSYNEVYGHLGGDACLQRVTEAMVRGLRRPSDFLGRYGGEEFIAVLPGTDAVGAKIVAERLRATVAALQMPHEASICARVVTISAGFASFKVLGDLAVDRLIAAADGALLRAKANGRNRIEGDAPLVRPAVRVSAQRWQRFAPVFADPWFADRIPGFLAETADEARAISGALREGELEKIRVSTQLLRSTASQFGFPLISRLADDLEQACGRSDPDAIAENADELLQYVTHVQVVYRRPVAEPALR